MQSQVEMPDREDTSMDAMQRPYLNPRLHRGLPHSQAAQLFK
jgi:hypothetical protein